MPTASASSSALCQDWSWVVPRTAMQFTGSLFFIAGVSLANTLVV
jgi:hypothetical protein